MFGGQSLVDEGTLNDVAAGAAHVAFAETGLFQHGPDVRKYRRAAAQHEAVVFPLDVRQAEVAAQVSSRQESRDSPLLPEGLAGHGRVRAVGTGAALGRWIPRRIHL